MKGWQKIKRITRKIMRSKFMVLVAILMVWFAGAQVKDASADYNFSTAYQYYLLGSQGEELQEDSGDEDVALSLGSLGSGGVSGEFSYDDIVNTANEDNKEEAKKFAYTMATYSSFNYFSNKVQGFSSILSLVGRFVFLIIFGLLAILMDLMHLVIPSLVSLVAKLNVIGLLANVVTESEYTSELLEVLDNMGISEETVKTFTELFLTFAVAMIILTIAGVFRRPGEVDQRSVSKLKGRLLSLVFLPMVIGFSATLLEEVIDATTDQDGSSGSFSRYLVDNRAWAYNFNFAPQGDSGKDSDIGDDSPDDGTYVDLKYDPYTGTGEDRISAINSKSSLADPDQAFPNTSMVIAYGANESFTATDFINYKGTEASKNFYGTEEETADGEGTTFGSYHEYAKKMAEETVEDSDPPKLIDDGHSFNARGDKNESIDQSGGYIEAVDDYKDGDDALKTTPQIAWRDRFIYGAKNAGDKMDEYYGEKPSLEQITNQVGRGGQSAFTDQSMFLILSTQFDETGGRYYLDAPARGIMQAKASFDSNRSDYYVVSMVGNPLFTIFGLLSTPVIQLVVLCAVGVAVMSLGLIDMNIKPFMAWIKGMTLGDLEYAQALLVYTVGIIGTVICLIAIPPMLGSALEFIAQLFTEIPVELADADPTTPQGSLAKHGVGLIFTSFVSIFVGFLYLKSPFFRERLTELFTMPWAWAKSTGERLEIQANGGAGMRMKQEQSRMEQKNRLNQTLNSANERQTDRDRMRFNELQTQNNRADTPWSRAKNWAQTTKDGISSDLKSPFMTNKKQAKLEAQAEQQALQEQGQNPGQVVSGGGEKAKSATTVSNGENMASESDLATNDEEQVTSTKTVAQNGMYERAMNSLRETEVDSSSSGSLQADSIEASQALENFKKDPNEETYKEARDKMAILNQNAHSGDYEQEQVDKVDRASEEFYNLSKSYEVKEESQIREDFRNSQLATGVQSGGAPTGENKTSGGQNVSTNNTYQTSQSDANGNTTYNNVHQENLTERQGNTTEQIRNVTNTNSQTQNTNHQTEGNNAYHTQTVNQGNVSQNTTNNQSTRNIQEGMRQQTTNHVYHNKQVQQLANSLGSASDNPQVSRALNDLNSSQSDTDFQKGMSKLQQSIQHLDQNEGKNIDQDKLSSSLDKMFEINQKSNESRD